MTSSPPQCEIIIRQLLIMVCSPSLMPMMTLSLTGLHLVFHVTIDAIRKILMATVIARYGDMVLSSIARV